MSRRTAADRHRDSAPARSGPELIDQLVAYHHPTRQRILEALSLRGPASVGTIAEQCGLAPGSVSHHLKPLHRAGFVEPAPELAADTRASWWRLARTSVSYDATDYPDGSRAREVVALAEKANDERHVRAIQAWRSGGRTYRWPGNAPAAPPTPPSPPPPTRSPTWSTGSPRSCATGRWRATPTERHGRTWNGATSWRSRTSCPTPTRASGDGRDDSRVSPAVGAGADP